MKKLSFLTGLVLVSLLFVACDKKKDEPIPKLKFDPASVSLVVGAEATAKVTGGTAPYTAKSAADATATVSVDGSNVKVKGVKEGNTEITVTDKNKVTGKLIVEVKKGLSFDPATVEVKVGEEKSVKVTGGTAPYTAKSAADATATVSVDGSNVKVKGVKEGNTEITVSDKDKKVEGKFTVKVVK